MKTATAALAFVCGLAFTSTTLAQQRRSADTWQFVPVGPPTSDPSTKATQRPLTAPIKKPSALGREILRRSFDGVDSLEGCGMFCRPPDTNAAVGGNFVVETVNVTLRIWNRTMGNMLLDESLATTFGGAATDGDPYVVYDDIADRWYIFSFDSDHTGLFFAVSLDNDPTHGFQTFHLHDPPFPAGFPDYGKAGFNRDAIFFAFNDFGPTSGFSGAATVVAIDKFAALAGQLSFFVSTPPAFQFKGMPPAQMHGDKTGGVEWFVSTDGTDFGGSTIRVTRLTNYLSNTPNYTLTSLPVTPYQNAPLAEQPGGFVTTGPNTTTTQVQFHRGHLLTALASGLAPDGFTYPKTQIFDVDITGAAPVLESEFVIDPGNKIAAQMPSVDMDKHGKLGVTWMESSASEFLSMWVATLDPNTGKLTSTVAAPGNGFFAFSDRIGDYSTTVLDPEGETFWSANEYIGDRSDIVIWRTNLTAFQAGEKSKVIAQR